MKETPAYAKLEIDAEAELEEIRLRHLQGQHPQSTHGRGKPDGQPFRSASDVREAETDEDIDARPGTKRLRSVSESLDADTISSIKVYTDYDSDAITMQATLRGWKDPDPDERALTDLHSSRLSAAIDKSDIEPGTTVYRGQTSGVKLDQMEAGGEIELKGFTSTSLNPGVAQPLALAEADDSAIFEIKPKKGLYVTPHSTSKGNQQEVLLNHKARYRIVSVQRNVTFEDEFGPEEGFNVVQLEEI